MSRLFLPAATNYCTNPSFEGTYVNGLAPLWAKLDSGMSGTLVYEAVAGRTGGQAQRMAYTAAAGDNEDWCLLDSPTTAVGSFAAGESATVSGYAKFSATGGCGFVVTLNALDAGGGFLASQAVAISASADWTRFSATYASLPANTSKLYFRFLVNSMNNGDSFDFIIDDFMIEKSAFPTPYFDGSTSDSLNASTYAWTGTANASTSTRTASDLRFTTGIPANLMQPSATIAARWVPLFSSSIAGDKVFVDLRLASGKALYVETQSNNCKAVTWTGGSEEACTRISMTYAVGDRCSLIVRHANAATLDVYANGVAATQGVQTNNFDAAASTIYLGHLAGPVSYAACYLSPVIISPQRKSDAWTTAMDTLLRASVVDLPAIKRMMAPGDALFTGNQADLSTMYTKGS